MPNFVAFLMVSFLIVKKKQQQKSYNINTNIVKTTEHVGQSWPVIPTLRRERLGNMTSWPDQVPG